MLATAEQSGRFDPQVDDEVEFLLTTFDTAMRELAKTTSEDLESVRRLLIADLESGVMLCDQRGEVLALNQAGASLVTGSSGDGASSSSNENDPTRPITITIRAALRVRPFMPDNGPSPTPACAARA